MRQFYREWNQSSTNLAQPVRDSRSSDPVLQQPAGGTRSQPESILQRAIGEIEARANRSDAPAGSDESRVVLTVLERIPWGQNIDLFTKVKDPVCRLWYARKTIENGWSRAVLTVQIESDLHARQGSAVTNFERTLPAPDSDLAQETFKDRYILDFIAGDGHLHERHLQARLTTHIVRFLLELGKGFSFVGERYPLDVGGDEFFIDLLFYHLRLHCYVVVELKTGKFSPRDMGQVSFYLEAIDRQVRDHAVDRPSIGLVLCKEKNNLVVEYALARLDRPTAVATWELTGALPDELKDSLPSVEQLKAELQDMQLSES